MAESLKESEARTAQAFDGKLAAREAPADEKVALMRKEMRDTLFEAAQARSERMDRQKEEIVRELRITILERAAL